MLNPLIDREKARNRNFSTTWTRINSVALENTIPNSAPVMNSNQNANNRMASLSRIIKQHSVTLNFSVIKVVIIKFSYTKHSHAHTLAVHTSHIQHDKHPASRTNNETWRKTNVIVLGQSVNYSFTCVSLCVANARMCE